MASSGPLGESAPGFGPSVLPGRLSRTWTAASGLLLVLFLVLHLGGVSLAVVAPERFSRYATSLHAAPWLPLAELGLLAVAATHIGFSLHKAIRNRRAGNRAALASRRGDPLAALAARSQFAAGLLTLIFLVFHLGQLRWPRPAAGADLAALQAILSQPASLLLYLAAALAIGLHLFHGGEAAHRSLGLLDPRHGLLIRRTGRGLALLVAGGFAGLSLWIALPALAGGGA